MNDLFLPVIVPYPPVVSSSRVSVRFLSDSVSTTILHTKVSHDYKPELR